MTSLLVVAAVLIGLWLVSLALMTLLASRLPPGLLRDVAEFLPACVTTARRLRADPAVPRRAKVALLVAVLWVLSPIDLLPEFLPVIGPLDDVVAVVLLLRYAARSIPRPVLEAAWPANPATLSRLLGRMPRVPDVRLRPYTDDDLSMTLALETDPVAMAELGGPRDEAAVRDVHPRRVATPWWLTIEADGEAVGALGIWETEHDGDPIHETGWMVLPAAHGRGIASAALGLLLERVREDGAADAVHAFPGATNAASNRLCEKHGFALEGPTEVEFGDATLRVNHWVLRLTAVD